MDSEDISYMHEAEDRREAAFVRWVAAILIIGVFAISLLGHAVAG